MANSEVLKYLTDLPTLADKSKSGKLMLKTRDIKCIKPYLKDKVSLDQVNFPTTRTTLNDKSVYLKSSKPNILGGLTPDILFSRIYNELGISSVNYYPMIVKPSLFSSETLTMNVSEDLMMVDCLNMYRADLLLHLSDDLYSLGEKNLSLKAILKNKDRLMEMNPDSIISNDKFFADLTSMVVVDNILMEHDRKPSNFFIACDKDNNYLDTITIDHEKKAFNCFRHTSPNQFIYSFTNYSNYYYPVAICPIESDDESYLDKLKSIRALKIDGLVSPTIFEKISNLDVDKVTSLAECTCGCQLNPKYKQMVRDLIDFDKDIICK